MLTVTDRLNWREVFARSPSPTQAGRHFVFMLYTRPCITKLIRQAAHHMLFCVTECLPDDVITDKTERWTPVYLIITLDRRTSHYGQPGSTRHMAFDTELSLMFFDEDILFQALRRRRGLWRNSNTSPHPVQPVDKLHGNQRHLLFAFRRRVLILLFASPVVELRFIQVKFAGSCGHTTRSASFRLRDEIRWRVRLRIF